MTTASDRATHGQLASGFRAIERVLLVVDRHDDAGGSGVRVSTRRHRCQSINLADILLMFLYTEVIGMIAVFYGGKESPFVYPIFIAITALARLIVLQGKTMAPENIVFEAGAILLLALRRRSIIARTSRS